MLYRFWVFSGTGNTWHAANFMAERLRGLGHETALTLIDMETPVPEAAGAVDVFMFPVYATSVPHLMARWMGKLPEHGGKAAVVSTNGRVSTRWRDGHQGTALHQARGILSRRGYEVFLSDTLDYPHNLTSAFPPVPDAAEATIIHDAGLRAEKIAERLHSLKEYHRKIMFFHWIYSPLFGWLYRLLGRRFLGKLLASTSDCNGCGLCARSCPAKAIRMEHGRPRWGWNCEHCERCINLCPKRAVQTPVSRWLLLITLMFTPWHGALESWLSRLGAAWPSVWVWTLDTAIAVVLFVLLDRVLFLVERVPGVSTVTGFSWTRFLRRYLAPGFERGGLGRGR